MKGYRTAQRGRLSDFLRQHPDEQFTIEEMAGAIEGISASAIYRNIRQMVADGSVRRFENEGSRTFLYQYLGDGGCTAHVHLKCSACGQILHLSAELTEALAAAVEESNHFHLDKGKTFLSGSCTSCK